MDLHQLRTFAAVAREKSITRASEVLHLSQPAVSAHIKALEEELGLAVFERTARGMSLTPEGERLLDKAEQTLAAYRELQEEARRLKGHLTGRLRLGAGSNGHDAHVGRLLTAFAERYPEVEVTLAHGASAELLNGLASGRLDACFYNEAAEPEPSLAALEVARFGIFLAAPPGLFAPEAPLDWRALGELQWIYPAASACCGRTAEALFKAHALRPRRVLSVDREAVTRTLVAGGVGVGLLHADTARSAQERGEVALLLEANAAVRVLFAYPQSRAKDPLLLAAAGFLAPASLSGERGSPG